VQDEDNDGYNTSDEEFERQLEEAALIEEQEKVEKARKPKMKKGRGRNAKKKSRKPNANGDDGDGYEVFTNSLHANIFAQCEWQHCAMFAI
jgi:hypothetical protein